MESTVESIKGVKSTHFSPNIHSTLVINKND